MEKRGWNSLPARLAERSGAIDIVGVSGAATACAVAEIQRRCRLPMVVVTDSVKGAETFFEQLCFFCGDTATGPRLFPAYNISPYKLIAYHNETAARRIQTLYHMVEGPEPSIYVTPVDAILQRLMPKPTFIDFSELVMAGEELDRDRVI